MFALPSHPADTVPDEPAEPELGLSRTHTQFSVCVCVCVAEPDSAFGGLFHSQPRISAHMRQLPACQPCLPASRARTCAPFHPKTVDAHRHGARLHLRRLRSRPSLANPARAKKAPNRMQSLTTRRRPLLPPPLLNLRAVSVGRGTLCSNPATAVLEATAPAPAPAPEACSSVQTPSVKDTGPSGVPLLVTIGLCWGK